MVVEGLPQLSHGAAGRQACGHFHNQPFVGPKSSSPTKFNHPLCSSAVQGVEFWAVNTDAQALANHAALNKVQIGTELTRGLGCGGNPNLGQQAALESQEALKKMVQGADLVFITAGQWRSVCTCTAVAVQLCSTSAVSICTCC